MKKEQYMVFIAIVFTINLLVNLYIFSRTRGVFPEGNPLWWTAAIVFWVIAFSYVIGRFVERGGAMALAEPF
ncbi:MAG TPA: hypothetical protein VKA10_04040, partial [Prolixibacteraceae bacterium]|nr:hypothetical protein [Prolixibacteraceae bacterium]